MENLEKQYGNALRLLEGGQFSEGNGQLTQLARLGFPPAEHSLGYCYEEGFGIKKDIAQAIYWYIAAANHGNAPSQTNLATIYLNGVNGAKDYEKAAYWFNAAAVQGYALGQYNLARMYEGGLGVDCNLEKALELYLAAVRRGHIAAANNIGCIYFKSGNGPRNRSLAEEWFRYGSENGDALAQQNLERLIASA